MRVFTTFVLLVVPLVVASCGEDRVSTKPKPPVIGDEILFSSNRTEFLTDLYVVNVDGVGLYRMTADTLEDWQPRWSPDGTKIVFVHRSDPHGDSTNVTVMNADGSNRIRLTRNFRDSNPSWSPDGSQIAYQNGYDMRNQLWVMNADGSSRHLLIDADSLEAVRDISWTSQNTFLGGDWLGLVQFDADGKNRTRIVSLWNAADSYPRMSPDGSKIAFEWEGPLQGGYPTNIYLVNADGSDLKPITDAMNHVGHPVWSPDGTRIAFTGNDFVLWTMNADGSDPAPVLLNTPFYNLSDYPGDWK